MTPIAHLIDGEDAATLTRSTTGLTDAHREFIRLLAQVAVDDYLRELDAQPVIGGDQ
jgi:hypothetical protein